MAAQFEELLTADEFTQLMEASIPEDLKFLATRPEVSNFLLARADRIVGVNARLFAERNEILEDSRNICNVSNNPFVPKMPFVFPECSLGDILEITAQPE